MRYRQIGLVFKCLFIILFFGLIYIQVIKGNYYYDLSIKNSIRGISLEAARGRIFDRNDKILAETIPSFQVSIIPHEVKDKEVFFQELSQITEVSFNEIKENYKKHYSNPYTPVTLLNGCDKETIISLEERKMFLPGLIIDLPPKRFYPHDNICSHVLGYLGQIDYYRLTKLKSYGYNRRDLVGYSGVEEYYDLILRGEKGGVQVEVDNKGQQVSIVGYKPPKPGRDIQLTIDIRIQKILDELMKDRRGVAIIMNPYNGQIIALSSKPDYNPNEFIDKNNGDLSKLLQQESSPLLNRAISGQYPPGSVFKLISATAVLENKPSLSSSEFSCSGSLGIGGRSFKCWSQHDQENLRDAIIHSCNVYFYRLGLLIGPELISKYAYKLGLGKDTGVDLNYESEGFITSPRWKKLIKFQRWYKGDTANFTIGQGDLLVTPLQMVRFISIFANGGRLVRPHLIKSIEKEEIAIPKSVDLDIDKELIDFVNLALYGVVNNSEGTASVLRIKEYKIHGKTGTAQVGRGKAHGWFVGYLGKDEPRFAICVFLENVGSSQFSCLLAKRIIKRMIKEDLIQ